MAVIVWFPGKNPGVNCLSRCQMALRGCTKRRPVLFLRYQQQSRYALVGHRQTRLIPKCRAAAVRENKAQQSPKA